MREEGIDAEALKGLREGWRLGAEDFLERLIGRLELTPGESHGRERLESDERRAERIVRGELRRWRWKESDLAKKPKSSPEKVAVARRLREETTMSLKWIAGKLSMGGWKNVANKLSKLQNENAKRKD